MDAQYQLTQSDLDLDYPVASSSRLPDTSPPPLLISDADESWLSDSKVQEVIGRQRADCDCDRWRLHPESQDTSNEHAQEQVVATQKEEAVDTVIDNESFCSQAKKSTPEDLVVATEEDNSVSSPVFYSHFLSDHFPLLLVFPFDSCAPPPIQPFRTALLPVCKEDPHANHTPALAILGS